MPASKTKDAGSLPEKVCSNKAMCLPNAVFIVRRRPVAKWKSKNDIERDPGTSISSKICSYSVHYTLYATTYWRSVSLPINNPVGTLITIKVFSLDGQGEGIALV